MTLSSLRHTTDRDVALDASVMYVATLLVTGLVRAGVRGGRVDGLTAPAARAVDEQQAEALFKSLLQGETVNSFTVLYFVIYTWQNCSLRN